MKHFISALVILALAAVATAGGLRSQIEAMNRKISTIMKNRDVDAFIRAEKSNVTSDFKYTDHGQVETFDEMVAGMKAGFAMTAKVTMANATILSFSEKGNDASCSTKHVMMGITMDAKRKQHKLVFSGVSEETYRNEHGKWLLASMTWKSNKVTMDGKPVTN